MTLLGIDCDRDLSIRLGSPYAAAPAPEFLISFRRPTERGKIGAIRVYDAGGDEADLVWASKAANSRRARGVYRFTYGVSPIGMKNSLAPKELEHGHVYEVCAKGREFNCARYTIDTDGTLKPTKRPKSAYRKIPRELR